MSWPTTATDDATGQLVLGGVGVNELAQQFGTPLYVFDEATLRGRARMFAETFRAAYPRSRVVFAGKANCSPTIINILHQVGLGLDVVSGGELYAGLASGVPAAAMTFHGNNKDEIELREAVAAGVGLIAIDNDWEIELLSRIVTDSGVVRCLIRLNPGVEPNTHDKLRTGATDSKFGFPVDGGSAARAVERVTQTPGLELAGYHAHVGSQIFDPRLVGQTLRHMLSFAADMRSRFGVVPEVISPGGGFGVDDGASGNDVSIAGWASVAAETLTRECERHRLPLPELVVEPGRSIVGPAGVALYRIGGRKVIAGVRVYVAVDGGMSDNIRPALYGARYTARIANRAAGEATETVTIAGKYCESGDVLITDLPLAQTEPGDLLAIPMAGAYCLAMASNYNMAARPAAVMVSSGQARLFRRRETYAEILTTEARPGSAFEGRGESSRQDGGLR
ncbi:MAG: diaminopimelate decarboxylase [Chloroflexia bacterium]|nr:diaminopimelate decarboxylase [Chloroflexia bacterium]